MYYLSLIYIETGKFNEAEQILKQIISINPKQVNAFFKSCYGLFKTEKTH